MAAPSSGALAATAVLGPFAMVILILLIVAGANADDAAAITTPACGGGGTGQRTATGITLDAEQMGNAATIVNTTAARTGPRLPAYAAIVAIATAYQESTLHNDTTEHDHDSEGLFQQRVSYYTKAVADDPVKATNAFLDRLIGVPHWQNIPLTEAASDVQRPRADLRDRYGRWQALATDLVGQLWPGATHSRSATSAPICRGGGGAGPIVGEHGNNVAGTTTIPGGMHITGSTAGKHAVAFALAQLGKPYVWGAAGPEAYDCSGLTMAAWAAAGVPLPHFTGDQVSAGTPAPTTLATASAGDLVFIPGSDGTPTAPRHVGMVAGYIPTNKGHRLLIIQAPMTGVPVELTDATEWAGQIVAVRHIR